MTSAGVQTLRPSRKTANHGDNKEQECNGVDGYVDHLVSILGGSFNGCNIGNVGPETDRTTSVFDVDIGVDWRHLDHLRR